MDNDKTKADFISLLTPNYYKIHSFVFSLVANKADAEDVLQGTLSNMWENFDNFERGTKFLSWAYAVAKFQVLTYRKKQKRSILYFSDEAINLIESESKKLAHEMDDRYEYLSKCMRRLPERDMFLIEKRFRANVSIKDLAQELGTTANIVYKRMTRIKKALLKCVHLSLAGRNNI